MQKFPVKNCQSQEEQAAGDFKNISYNKKVQRFCWTFLLQQVYLAPQNY